MLKRLIGNYFFIFSKRHRLFEVSAPPSMQMYMLRFALRE
jgi:hypothetical protein